MLGLAVQPPSRARPGAPLYPPIAARLSSETSVFEELSQKWAVATLVRSSGEVLHDKLSGKVADSAHPLPESGANSGPVQWFDRAYFYFPDLKIDEPGRYKIRISLMQMDYSGVSSPHGEAVVCEEVDSRSIVIDDRAPSPTIPRGYSQSCWRPNLTCIDGQERAFLRVLKADGQQIPSPHTG